MGVAVAGLRIWLFPVFAVVALPLAVGQQGRESVNCWPCCGLAGANVVSADIVEVSPAYDHAEITGIAAAHVGFELLSVLALDLSNIHTVG